VGARDACSIAERRRRRRDGGGDGDPADVGGKATRLPDCHDRYVDRKNAAVSLKRFLSAIVLDAIDDRATGCCRLVPRLRAGRNKFLEAVGCARQAIAVRAKGRPELRAGRG